MHNTVAYLLMPAKSPPMPSSTHPRAARTRSGLRYHHRRKPGSRARNNLSGHIISGQGKIPRPQRAGIARVTKPRQFPFIVQKTKARVCIELVAAKLSGVIISGSEVGFSSPLI